MKAEKAVYYCKFFCRHQMIQPKYLYKFYIKAMQDKQGLVKEA